MLGCLLQKLLLNGAAGLRNCLQGLEHGTLHHITIWCYWLSHTIEFRRIVKRIPGFVALAHSHICTLWSIIKGQLNFEKSTWQPDPFLVNCSNLKINKML